MQVKPQGNNVPPPPPCHTQSNLTVTVMSVSMFKEFPTLVKFSVHIA